MPGIVTVDRGQVGVGTLVVFVSMVLVAAIAAGVLVNTAEFLQSTGDGAGTGPTPERGPPLEVVAVTGEDVADGRIGDLVLVVKTTPGAGEVDLRDVTIRWVGPEGADRLGYDATPGFAAEVRRDADGSWPVLDDPADRAAIGLDLDDDGPTVTGTTVAPLEPDDAVTIVITTERGATAEVALEVPPSLGSAPTIDL